MSQNEKKKLFDDSSSDDDEDTKLKINKSYAQRYDEWREAEIKKKLEDRYGNLDDQLSSSSSDDDDDPQVLEKALSKDFFEVISQLRKKDPKIYNPEVRFFNAEGEPSTSQQKKKKEKPIYLRDYERKLIVERGGVLSDDESDTEVQQRPASPSVAEKERSLKESLSKIVHSDSDDDEGLLTKKVKTADEKKKEEEDYLEWLRGRKEELKDKSLEESLSHLKEEWSNPNLDDGEKFLRDYILNKRYLGGGEDDVDTGNLTDDDYQDEYMDEFERKYNFRFEEPDSEFLKRYPRTIDSSVRKQDDRRKRHREEVKKRKEEEKLRQREELKVLKSLKRKEIVKKIEKIKEITGNAELGISDKDLEEEFDPEEHDRRMKELFNEDYYQEGDDEMALEDLPLPPLEEELVDDYENWDEYEGGEEEEPHCEDPDFNMDCDYDPEAARLAKDAQPKSSRERRKLKRQSRFGTLVRKKKPEFDPNEKSFQQYVDEYYGIDYEDIVGGQPCRFKYRKVVPNSFGLTIEEILAADDKELNAWVSIKKATALRPDHVELNEKRIYELKAQNEALKRKILPSLYKHENENDEDSQDRPRSKKKSKSSGEGNPSNLALEEQVDQDAPRSKKKKQSLGADNEDEATKLDIGDGSRSKKKRKYSGEEDANCQIETKASPVESKTGPGRDSERTVENVASAKESSKKKKTDVEKAVCTSAADNAESQVLPKQKKKIKGGNKPAECEKSETFAGEENDPNQGHPQKLSKRQRKNLKKQMSGGLCEKTQKVGMKRPADAMDESTKEDGSPENRLKGSNSKWNKTRGENETSQQSKRRKLDSGITEKPKKIFAENGKQSKSSSEEKNEMSQNRVSQNSIPVSSKRKSRRGRERKKQHSLQNAAGGNARNIEAEKKARAARRLNNKAAPILGDMSDSRLKAYGLNPKKFKNKLKYA